MIPFVDPLSQLWPPADGIEVECPKCHRRGRVRRTHQWNTRVAHTCPGPWTLDSFVAVAR